MCLVTCVYDIVMSQRRYRVTFNGWIDDDVPLSYETKECTSYDNTTNEGVGCDAPLTGMQTTTVVGFKLPFTKPDATLACVILGWQNQNF